ncbi:uncharacterized protein LOC120327185 [Styela clava]
MENKKFTLILAMIRVACGFLLETPDMHCNKILMHNDKIQGSDTPSPIEVNHCTNLLRSNTRACQLDTSSCDFPCRFGYELDENGCPKRDCTCATEGIFEGDIKFTLDDIPLLIEAYDEPPQDKQQAASENMPRWDEDRVDGRVKIGYVIKSDMSSRARAAIEEAISKYTEETCIDFVPRTDQNDYLLFASMGGCWSYVGRRRGPQYISIGSGCEWVGVVQHELLHALGFWHEQSRPDRDSYVEIRFDNIASNMKHNFNKRQAIDSMGSMYDKGSIMHYGGYAFSSNRQPTIVDITTGQPIKSQREGMSESDKYQVNKMYKCNAEGGGEEQPEWSTWSQWSSCSLTCGVGQKRRTRTCMLGSQTVSVQKCEGSAVLQENCKIKDCSTTSTGTWSSWLSWSTCSVSCGGGYRWRRRICNGGQCIGSVWQAGKCNTNSCSSSTGMFEANPIETSKQLCLSGNLYHGDFNGDKKSDLLCIFSSGWTQIIVDNEGDYFGKYLWQAQTTPCNNGAQIYIGDFNGDSSDDMMCINVNSGQLSVTFSEGGGFGYKPDWTVNVNNFCDEENEKIMVVDANGDGKSDLICRSNSGKVSILVNKHT